ncbi:MAG TPA: protein kinase [Gemmatimonadales bacterium]|nr:protein kinase [Gemmatimonadales bacterium]
MSELAVRLASTLAGRYRLERELGRGGMATVWLAEDVRHHRRVAIKVLHPELSAVLGGERFLKEIELTANLQHPHILPLFDSGEADGLLYYVMPYVEGEPLRARLERERQLPVAEAVRIATEVADALAYAHRHGVVHRDIKPENILLHDGRPLVADFGIALAVEQAGGERMTQTGLSLGTPQYMAPEQAMGERVIDQRADIYALGAVTYEMLAGEPPFAGPTAQAIVARMLTEEPPPLAAHRRSIPEHVEAAVLTALEKLPADRFATATEYAAALALAPATPRRRSPTAPSGAADARRWRTAALGALALAVFASGSAVWIWRTRPVALPPTRRAVFSLSSQFEVGGAQVAVSADGRTIATTDAGQLVVRRIDRLDLVPVPGSAGAVDPFLSADGTRIGFHRRGELVVERLDGSAALTVPFVSGRFPADAGGGRVVAVDSGGLVLLEPQAARRQQLLPAPALVDFLQPEMLPDGRHVLFAAMRGSPSRARVLALDLESHRVDTLLDGSALRPQYADGRLYFTRPDGTIHAVAFDPAAARTRGTPLPTGDETIVARQGQVAFAAGAGLIVSAQRPDNRVLLVAPDGRREVLTSEAGTFHNPRVSPDGRRVVFDRNVGGREGRDVWVLDLATHALSRITSAGDAHDPVWTPDGHHVTYLSPGTPGGPIFTVSADGAPGVRAIAVPGLVHPGAWLPDGRSYVAGHGQVENGPSDILLFHADGSPAESLVTSPYEEHSPAISPDGRWLAYMSDETGQRQVYVRALRGEGGRTLVSEGAGEEPAWSRDGRRLYYVEHRGSAARLLAARIAPGGAGVPPRVAGREVVLDPLRYEPVGNHANWDVTPDGRFVFVEPVGGGRLEMVLDWAPTAGGVAR